MVIGGKPTMSFGGGGAGAGDTGGPSGLGASGDVTVSAKGFRPSPLCQYMAAAAPPRTTITRTIPTHLRRPAGLLPCCDRAMAQHSAEDDAVLSAPSWSETAGAHSHRSGRHSHPLRPLVKDDHCARMAVRTPRLMAPVIRDRSKMISPKLPNIRGPRLASLGNPPRYDLVSRAASLSRPDYNLRDQLSRHVNKYPLFYPARLAVTSPRHAGGQLVKGAIFSARRRQRHVETR